MSCVSDLQGCVWPCVEYRITARSLSGSAAPFLIVTHVRMVLERQGEAGGRHVTHNHKDKKKVITHFHEQ